MKSFIFLFLFVLSFSSMAQDNVKLYKNIANSIDSLLSDTVNEGDMYAKVNEVQGKPDMKCKLSAYREPGKGVAKCEINFKIESNYTEETQYCQKSCFLINVYDLNTFSIVKRIESLEQNCIENLSSACE